jgi:putative ABC transport system permease protein
MLPGDPGSLQVLRAESAGDLRSGVEGDLNVVFVLLGLLALVAGMFAIAAVTQLSVAERTAEIGLRRALGARRRDISRQFLTETLIVGVLGGLVGAAVGVLVLVIASVVRGWTPVVDLRLIVGAVVVGALAGLVSGIIPALRASRIEPATALSGGGG